MVDKNTNNDIKEIKRPGQILDHVDTKEHLVELFNYITSLQEIEKEHKKCTRKHWQQKCAEHSINENIYKLRIDKAIEYINNNGIIDLNGYDLLDILRGEDE